MKRLALLVLAGLAAAVPAGQSAWAQEFPTRQITLIAPWPAGGAVDAICRALAQPLSERLGKSVVVENRPGAGSVIGTAAGAKAAPDGYTMVMAGSGSLAISATMYKKLPYDPVKDFIPLTMGAKIPFVLVVNPSLPVHSPAELVAYAKANPGKLSFASGGPGSPHHLYGELLKSMTGIEMTHVPYKGSAPALTDVIAGHVPLLFSDTVPSLPQIREGKVRALGVSTAVRSNCNASSTARSHAGARSCSRPAWPGRSSGGRSHAGGRTLRLTQREPDDHKNRVGHISVRHMCDDGVLSRPRPSFGCLKLRPMMSTKSSRSTLASGSNE